jgi:hypothetical protein
VLLLRRVAPLAVLVAGLVTQLIAVAAGLSSHTPVTPLLFFVLVLYSVGLLEERARAAGGLALALGLVLATLFVARHNGETFDGTDIPFVALVCSTPWFELEVVDDGPGNDDGHVGGHGLAGMRERVNVFGGDFAAGPRPDGRFAVRVRLPVEAEPA